MRKLIILFLVVCSISLKAQRSQSIEVRININGLPEYVFDSLDIEYSSKYGYHVLWIHPNGSYRPFKKDYFQFLGVADSAYNRKTKTDHLNIYVETDKELEKYDKEIGGIKYKNVKFSELKDIDIIKVKLDKEVKVK